ncbi:MULTISPECIES: F0F1 ATP synthase subunit delta [Thalassotalea]|uniref:F0F1 ATP synthase subunit delta n=1 Tax=Thalassotalea TaxID=1518149 RepID=UPI0009433878|nr:MULTISPECIES: F0F1 ATP synthase subunit delta [Thalassotalea]OKY27533.1 F0F1 ATP synthase subunit delta [Thalassotalea sp. PP2-459]
MSELTTIARPYAKAAFEYAVAAGAVDAWQEMLVFASEVSTNETMTSYLSGGASVEQAQDLFIKVCDEQLNPQGQNLIKVMAENERLLVLPQVSEQFGLLKAEYEKEITVDVSSAVELTADQQVSISAALEKRLARKVKLNCIVDANVVSGLVIKAGDMVIDGSVRGKLNRLATTMQS